MIDAFLEAGYTYFDTSYVYHNGKSEEATRKAVVERHPRDSFTVATKFPTFMEIPEEKIEETFQSQLDRLGVGYIDYYIQPSGLLSHDRESDPLGLLPYFSSVIRI